MNRRNFLKRLGGGAAVLASIPLLGVPGTREAQRQRYITATSNVQAAQRHAMGLVFNGCIIPKGATINSARLVLDHVSLHPAGEGLPHTGIVLQHAWPPDWETSRDVTALVQEFARSVNEGRLAIDYTEPA